MKIILEFILLLIVACFAIWLMPLAIGVLVAVVKFQSGRILGGIVAIMIGLFCQIVWMCILRGGDVPFGGDDEDCPYCGSGDTDGNHCYTCDEDF